MDPAFKQYLESKGLKEVQIFNRAVPIVFGVMSKLSCDCSSVVTVVVVTFEYAHSACFWSWWSLPKFNVFPRSLDRSFFFFLSICGCGVSADLALCLCWVCVQVKTT